MRKIFILLIVLVFAAQTGWSIGINKVGTVGAQFLKIGVGAQNIARGEAVVASVNDATAIYWNPSGIADLEKSQISFTHTEWLAEISYDWIAYAMPWNGNSIGFFLGLLSMSDMEQTTLEKQEGTGVKFSCYDMVIGVSYAKRLTDKFATGINAKYVRQVIWDLSANGVAFDLGFQYHTGWKSLRLGMNMSNFGTDMKYSGQHLKHEAQIYPDAPTTYEDVPVYVESRAYPLPLNFRVGLAYDLVKDDQNSLTLTLDGTQPNDGEEVGAFGLEYSFRGVFKGRLGYEYSNEEGFEKGFCAGFGLSWGLGSLKSLIDYAYADFGRLESVHRFTLGFEF